MTADTHPSDLTLARWAGGRLPAGEAAALASHVEACDDCAERALAVAAATVPLAAVGPADDEAAGAALPDLARAAGLESGRPPRRLFLRFVPAAAAAALLLAAGLAVYRSAARSPETAIGASPAGKPAPTATAFETAGETEQRALADGSSLTMFPGTRLSFSVEPDGSRRLLLKEGCVDLDVSRERGPFTVSARGGDVVVTGTRFAVRSFRLSPPEPRAAGIDVLAVAVREGHVRVRSAGGVAALGAGQACLAVGQMPIRLLSGEGGGPPMPGASPEARLQGAAGFWGTADDPARTLQEALEDDSVERRQVAAEAALFRPEGRFLPILAAAWARQTDPGTRDAVRKAALRIDPSWTQGQPGK